MTTPDPDYAELLAKVEALLAEVKRMRFEIWAKAWSSGKHRDAPPCPLPVL